MPDSAEIQNQQNRDGGWPYQAGAASWTEPTCYALLALAASGQAQSDAARSGSQWLARHQREDGGLAPCEPVAESTWLTALTLLLPQEIPGGVDRARAAKWVLAQTGRESGWAYSLRMLLLGVRSETSLSFDGWPWYPGAAAWTIPTALSVLALEKLGRQNLGRQNMDAQLKRRIAQGRSFLLARRCRDGGWNHGSTKALGYDSDSYPETTGVGLLAMHGSDGPEIARAVARAEEHLAVCESHQAASWLRLGLLAHGREPKALSLVRRGQTLEIALGILADAAQQGTNLFLG
jgi:hypothetical protein